MIGTKKNETTFTEDKQPLKRRGKSERTKILEAMERSQKTEEGFYNLLVERAFNPKDQFGFGEMLKRISPIPKQVAPNINFEFDGLLKPHAQAAQVIKGAADGVIPPDIANTFIQSIKAMIDIEEHTDLKARIEEIEKSLGINNE